MDIPPEAPDQLRNLTEKIRALGRFIGTIRIPAASTLVTGTLVVAGGLLLLVVLTYRAPGERYPLQRTLETGSKRELVLLAADGTPFARRGGCVEAPVALDEVPRHFIDALLAMEDRRFFYHFGIDPIGVARAFLANLEAGRIVQGGSTITQQLVKISYLNGEKTFERKLEEALIVLRLELLLTKKQILERYMSRAYFGQGCFGVRAAARRYFNSAVGDLTLAESAMLVALLRSPGRLGENEGDARARARLVLRAMVEDGRLEADGVPDLKLARFRPSDRRETGPNYADWIADTLRVPEPKKLEPLKVHTTFRPDLQAAAERAVEKILAREGARMKATEAALVAMRPDGRVVAMVGGRDYRASQYNRAVQALRQPGSSFKMFVYLAALRSGARTDMLVSDEPLSIGDWSPENYSRGYRGLVTLTQAFSSSINTAAVRVSEATGRDRVIEAARDLGISTRLTKTPSLALGASEVTLLELTAAYAAIAADAYPVKPWAVASLGEETSGAVRPPEGAGRWRLMAGEPLRELLESTVQRGTGRAARLPVRTYGKTGTSQEYRDAWFIGFAGNLVVGVWVGNDDNAPMRRVTGGSLPARIWRAFMGEAIRTDTEFQRELPQVAAFEMRPRPERVRYDIATRQDGQEQGRWTTSLWANYDRSGAFFGLPSLFAPPDEQFRREPGRRRGGRVMKSWQQMRDDGT